MRGFKLISCVFCLVGLSLNSLAQLPPLAEAAEYYFSKHDYVESLNLWKQVYKLEPTSEEVMSKVAHLELMLEGHETAEKTVVDFIRRYQNHLVDSDLRRLRHLYYETQTRFIKEEAQSSYFQALAKIKLKDFSKGLTLLNQAQKVEKGNLLIFEAEAQVEKRLGMFSKYYDTLKSGAVFNVFSTSWRDELLEAQYHFKDYSDILEWYESQKSQLTSRQRLVVGLTLLEKGEPRKAVFLLEKLQDNFQDKGMSSVVWYVLGKVYRENAALSKSFVTYSARFLNATKSLETPSENIWDPYRLAEKRAEVLKWQ